MQTCAQAFWEHTNIVQGKCMGFRVDSPSWSHQAVQMPLSWLQAPSWYPQILSTERHLHIMYIWGLSLPALFSVIATSKACHCDCHNTVSQHEASFDDVKKWDTLISLRKMKGIGRVRLIWDTPFLAVYQSGWWLWRYAFAQKLRHNQQQLQPNTGIGVMTTILLYRCRNYMSDVW